MRDTLGLKSYEFRDVSLNFMSFVSMAPRGTISHTGIERDLAFSTAFMQSAKDTVAMLDHEGVVTSVNAALTEFMHVQASDLVGRSITSIFVTESAQINVAISDAMGIEFELEALPGKSSKL